MKCGHCPVTSAQCQGETVPRVCRLVADGYPGYRELLLARAGESPEPLEPPPLWKQAANFATAVVGHVAAGMPLVDDATHAARVATCRSCPELTADSRCSKCGCPMDLGGMKPRWKDQKCPLNKWPGEV